MPFPTPKINQGQFNHNRTDNYSTLLAIIYSTRSWVQNSNSIRNYIYMYKKKINKTQLRERPVLEGYEQERGQHRPD